MSSQFPEEKLKSRVNLVEAQTAKVSPDLGPRFELLDLVGHGAMGSVWRVRDSSVDKILAVKILHATLAVSDRFALKRFNQEANTVAGLTHEHLVAVYDSGITEDGSPYILMDYVEGENLAEVLKREGALSKSRAIEIFRQICDALAHAHSKGVVHCDLKPSNIILSKNEHGAESVKIVDFGIAKIMPSMLDQTSNLTQANNLLGSPLYMSPEQCKGESLDTRSDLYSLGCVLYELLTGKPAFAEENPIKTILKHLNDEIVIPKGQISDELAAIVERCLEKDPSDRYQSIAQVAFDVRLAIEGKSRPRTNRAERRLLSLSSVWRRLLAACIDGSIVGSFGLGVYVMLLKFFVHYIYLEHSTISSSAMSWHACYSIFSMGFYDCFCVLSSPISMYTMPQMLNIADQSDRLLGVAVLEIFAVSLILFNWLYHAFMESSSKRGTLGKLAVGIVVVNENGKGLSFIEASKRHFAKALFFLGFTDVLLFPLYTLFRNQTWKQLTMLDFFCRRPIHDRVTGSYVCKPSQNYPDQIEKSESRRIMPAVIRKVLVSLLFYNAIFLAIGATTEGAMAHGFEVYCFVLYIIGLSFSSAFYLVYYGKRPN